MNKLLYLLLFTFLLASCKTATDQTTTAGEDTQENTEATSQAVDQTSAETAEKAPLKKLEELIDTEESAWPILETLIKEATNKVTVLPKDQSRSEEELVKSQVSTKSSMGSVIYETGGILINDGQIRILGSGSDQLKRTLMEWNRTKSYLKDGETPFFVLIADDPLGGFYAINGGGISNEQEHLGKIFYFTQRRAQWANLSMGYSDFVNFCFKGDLSQIYSLMTWDGVEAEMKAVPGDSGLAFDPYPWTEEALDLKPVKKTVVPIQELWDLHFIASKMTEQ